MARKQIVDGYRVIIEIPLENNARRERVYTPGRAHQLAGEVSRAVNRHLSPYFEDVPHPPVIFQDAHYVCEYCGDKWLEEDKVYNGGCCRADIDNDPARCSHCNGTGAVDTPYSGTDPSCPECDGEGRIANEISK